jgi:hypothetical protein
MPTVYDCIPQRLRREVDARLAVQAAARTAALQREIEALHEQYGDYDEAQFDDHQSEVRLVHMKEGAAEEIAAWVPVFAKHAPARLDDLRRALQPVPRCLVDLKAWHAQELKAFCEDLFKKALEISHAGKQGEHVASR